MVNIGAKSTSHRVAVASGRIHMKPSTLTAIEEMQVVARSEAQAQW